jgi:hypothetical protein
MSEIVSMDAIRSKARAAYAAGRSRDSHGFNWHAPALPTWLAEYDRVAALPRSHVAPAARQRIEQEQAA